MGRRRANETAAQFDQTMQDIVACVAGSVLVPRRNEPGKPHRLLLNPPARLHTDGGSLEMRVVLSYNVIPHTDAGYRVSLASYLYDVAEILEQLLV